MLYIVKRLYDEQWKPGTAPKQHTTESDRIFGSGNSIVVKRSYAQCLVAIETLRDKGLQSLPSGQSQGYYKALLASECPGDVPTDEKASYYTNLLQKASDEMVDTAEIGADAASDSDTDNSVIFGATRGHSRTSGNRKAKPGKTAGAHRAGHAGHAAMTTVAGHPVDVDGDVAPPTVATSGQDAEDLVSPVANWIPMNRQYDIEREVRLSPEDKGHYVRLRIQCKLSHCRHGHPKGCTKSRNVSVPHCRDFGAREPEAYLIAWAAAADRFGSRDLHMQHKPAKDDLRAVLREHGIIAQ
jgi:hypothetical protein